VTVAEPVATSARKDWSRPEFMRIARAIEEVTGISFPPNRRASAEAGMRRVMARLGIKDPLSLEMAALRKGAVMDALLDDLTIGESYFFREPAQFRFLADELLPKWAEEWPVSRELRIWSAGCATGQEPYSAAILLRENSWKRRSRITGTDIAEGRLEAARKGRFSKWSLRSLDSRLIDSWFAKNGTFFDLVPEIRSHVEFAALNLLDPTPRTETLEQDVIFCRNVLIYFEPPAVARIAERLLDSLAPGGWLFLGASDPHIAEVVACEVVVIPGATGYRKPVKGESTYTIRHAPLTLLLPDERVSEPAVVTFDASSMQVIEPSLQIDATKLPQSRALPEGPVREGAVREGAVRERDVRRQDFLSDAQDAVALLRDLANSGKLVEAGKMCASALERFPDQAELHLIDSVLAGEAGRWRDAERAAKRAVYLDRSLVVAHLALGNAHARLGDSIAARRSFENAAALLAGAPPDGEVTGSSGMSAARLIDIVKAHLAMLDAGRISTTGRR
jgi:chemotaxis protein methyltransferase CheR